jgi:hypothetical protein
MRKYALLAVLSLLILPSNATAQNSPGLRAGVGFSPDQLVAGIQFGLGARAGLIKIRPSFDVGLSDDVNTFSVNADVLLGLSLQGSSVSFFGGAGPTITYFDFDGPANDWKTGISLIAGINSAFKIARGADLEFRFGIGDAPDFRILLAIHL